mgnify:CR=1 FL=1|jgi:hypothetical protein
MQKRNRFCIFCILICNLLTTLNISSWWLMYVVKHYFLVLGFAISDKINTFVCVFHSIRFKVNKGWSSAELLFLCPYVKGCFPAPAGESVSAVFFFFIWSQFFLQTSDRKSRNVSIIFMFSFGETYVSAARAVRFALRSRRFFVAET